LTTPAPIHFLPVRLVSFETLPSTNDHLKELSLSGNVEEGTVILALNQTRGRGQMDREWNSEPGKNITLSLFLKPADLKAPEAFLLSKSIAISVYETILRFTKSKGEVSIKWPNDILVNGKKIAGILIENSILGDQVKSSIVGIGININQVEFSNTKATSLTLACGDKFDVIDIVDILIREIKNQYHLLIQKEYEELNQAYFERLHKPSDLNIFSINGIESGYTIRNIHDDGSILLEAGGTEKAYYYGEARWILE
jgi:BirA family biotin operon repressor/biotin-[acetyl-CoA-carboxylase] ligase